LPRGNTEEQVMGERLNWYDEKAPGNRAFFLNRPYGIGGSGKAGDVP